MSFVDRIEAGFDANGFGLWAVEVTATREFIGFTGLSRPRFEAHFMPAVEVGWRLARPAWGHGYATEAARAALDYAFGPAGLDEIVSFTTRTNARSRAVMDRLGMTHDPADDFDHPCSPKMIRCGRHVLYRLTARGGSRWGRRQPRATDQIRTVADRDPQRFRRADLPASVAVLLSVPAWP